MQIEDDFVYGVNGRYRYHSRPDVPYVGSVPLTQLVDELKTIVVVDPFFSEQRIGYALGDGGGTATLPLTFPVPFDTMVKLQGFTLRDGRHPSVILTADDYNDSVNECDGSMGGESHLAAGIRGKITVRGNDASVLAQRLGAIRAVVHRLYNPVDSRLQGLISPEELKRVLTTPKDSAGELERRVPV